MDPRMEQRRRTVAETTARRTLRRVLVVVAVVGLAAIGLLVLRSDRFSVAEVRVTGAVVTDPAGLATEVGLVGGTPLIEVDLGEVRDRLESEPRIRSATVARAWPDAVEIDVVERVAVAWVDVGGGWQHMSSDAVVLESGEPGADEPRIRGVADLPVPVEASLRFVEALDPALRSGMVIDARDVEIVAVWRSYTVRLGRATDMAEKARALEALMAEGPPEGAELTLIAPSRPAVLTTTTVADDGDAEAGDEGAEEP